MNFKKDIAHIVYASDDKFAEILGVSLTSLYDNSKDFSEIHVYVLDSGISSDNKKKLLSLSDIYQRQPIQFIEAKDISQVLGFDVSLDRGSISQYARLFISRDLDPNLGRVLYLDCDIIINQSLNELWCLDLHGNTIAALKDAFSRQYRKNIGLRPNDIMFNSGVMLIDLERWKSQKIEEHLLNFICSKKGKIQQGDQGALNAVLSQNTFCFEPKFNSITIFYDFNYQEMIQYRKPPEFYCEQQIQEAIENPTIIHFTTSFMSTRPWYVGCEHRYVQKWLTYKEKSPWFDTPLWQQNPPSGAKGLYICMVKRMPRKMAIGVSGILQAYGRPLLYR